ncbi:MAG: S8 family serine peptidase, partial [Clostridia bacterium]
MKKFYFWNLCIVLAFVLVVMSCVTVFASNVDVQSKGSIKLSNVQMLGGDKLQQAAGSKINFSDMMNRKIEMDQNEKVRVIINLGGKSLVNEYIKSQGQGNVAEFATSNEGIDLMKEIEAKQSYVMEKIAAAGIVVEYKFSYATLLSGFAATVRYGDIAAIEAIDGVKGVEISERYSIPTSVSAADLLTPTGILGNETGYNGEGTLTAVIDTGLDWKHISFQKMLNNPVLNLSNIENLVDNFYGNTKLGWNSYSATDFYKNSKVGFGFDYADMDANVIPSELCVTSFSGYHGTHVAGIIAGDDDIITGVAKNTQLAVMKVFGDGGTGAYTADILAALSDAVLLGVDSINMSLGSPIGFTYERDEDAQFINDMYDLVGELGISLNVAAGNENNSGYQSLNGANLAENPDIATIGSPSSYYAAFAVASVDGTLKNALVSDGRKMLYNEGIEAASSKPLDFMGLFLSKNTAGSYEYVAIGGFGEQKDYEGKDVKGKIALVQRGSSTFASKMKTAADNGAIACIIYNNQMGTINMSIDQELLIPVCSISVSDGNFMAIKGTGKVEISKSNADGPFMSDFSSWGVLADLSIKPEITAPGADILSAVPETYGKLYEYMSGTSMATPNLTGVTAVVRQYLKETHPEYTDKQVQELIYKLLMSTASIVKDVNGNPAFVRNQGAGVANVTNAINTKAYLSVTNSNRTKIELGDDADRTGMYTLRFNLVNIGNEALSYAISTKTFTETLAENGYAVAYLAHMLDKGGVKVSVTNGTYENGIVTVEGNETAAIKVVITLAEEEKAYLNESFINGYYVEGFVCLTSNNEDAIDLSIPYLAFYGDWANQRAFDYTIYEEGRLHFGATTPYATYSDGYMLPIGGYPYELAEGEAPVMANMENNSISLYNTSTSGIYTVRMYLLRDVAEMKYSLIDQLTGDTIWSDVAYNVQKSY